MEIIINTFTFVGVGGRLIMIVKKTLITVLSIAWQSWRVIEALLAQSLNFGLGKQSLFYETLLVQLIWQWLPNDLSIFLYLFCQNCSLKLGFSKLAVSILAIVEFKRLESRLHIKTIESNISDLTLLVRFLISASTNILRLSFKGFRHQKVLSRLSRSLRWWVQIGRARRLAHFFERQPSILIPLLRRTLNQGRQIKKVLRLLLPLGVKLVLHITHWHLAI